MSSCQDELFKRDNYGPANPCCAECWRTKRIQTPSVVTINYHTHNKLYERLCLNCAIESLIEPEQRLETENERPQITGRDQDLRPDPRCSSGKAESEDEQRANEQVDGEKGKVIWHNWVLEKNKEEYRCVTCDALVSFTLLSHLKDWPTSEQLNSVYDVYLNNQTKQPLVRSFDPAYK